MLGRLWIEMRIENPVEQAIKTLRAFGNRGAYRIAAQFAAGLPDEVRTCKNEIGCFLACDKAQVIGADAFELPRPSVLANPGP